MRPRAVACLTGVVLLVACAALPARGDGPWRAEIVDAETKEPLESVVALAVWTKHVRGPGGPSAEYHDSEEVLTDKDGRFTIAARSFFSVNPLVFFRGPQFVIFKAGYGRAVWPGYERLADDERKALGHWSRLLERHDVILEMPRLKVLEERKAYLDTGIQIDYLTVPLERRPFLQRALREERRTLGYGR